MSSELSEEELDLLSAATEKLRSIGLGDAFRFERLTGGRNNRVYVVHGRDRSAVLKWYHQCTDDERNRLSAELSFYEYANRCRATCVAELLSRNVFERFAVYSLLSGRRIEPQEIDAHYVHQAIEFIRKLNMYRNWSVWSDGVHVASEACFSIQEHLDCVSARVERLNRMTANSEHYREALEFVRATIAPALEVAIGDITRWARASGVDLTAPMRIEQRCISPSDFGFHNALLGADGRLKFFDFEYAGWDDPAKLLCDFYCQPEVPVPHDTWHQFADLTAELAGDTKLERQRQALLFPLYQVKWCCILLNEFVATDRLRRSFSQQQPPDLALQLEKAKRMASEIGRHDAPR